MFSPEHVGVFVIVLEASCACRRPILRSIRAVSIKEGLAGKLAYVHGGDLEKDGGWKVYMRCI